MKEIWSMEIKRIYVNDNEKGTLICEKCGKTRVINFSDFKNIGKPLKVKCSCGHFFFASIEVRKFYRKSTHLSGEYIKISNDVAKGIEKGVMTVEDLSRTGLGFRTKAAHNIRVKDVLRVRFTLDDAQRSEVHKSAIVKRISHDFVGAEFVDFDAFNATNRLLGFYLMPR
jgi:PilZ domain